MGYTAFMYGMIGFEAGVKDVAAIIAATRRLTSSTGKVGVKKNY
jgi:hypothetical protein